MRAAPSVWRSCRSTSRWRSKAKSRCTCSAKRGTHMHRLLARFVIPAVTIATVVSVHGQSVATKPNVVLVITDDVGYGDIGSYGAPDIKTPNIDSLARDGVRLTDFYAAPQCTPTRAALISGRYQQRF